MTTIRARISIGNETKAIENFGYDISMPAIMEHIKKRHFNKMQITSEIKSNIFAEIKYQIPFNQTVTYTIERIKIEEK